MKSQNECIDFLWVKVKHTIEVLDYYSKLPEISYALIFPDHLYLVWTLTNPVTIEEAKPVWDKLVQHFGPDLATYDIDQPPPLSGPEFKAATVKVNVEMPSYALKDFHLPVDSQSFSTSSGKKTNPQAKRIESQHNKDEDRNSNDPKVETLQDLLSKKVKSREEIIDGLMGRKDFIILSGPQKKFKSLASLNMAIRGAQGEPWLGFEILSPLRIGIVQQEISEESFQDRLKKMLKGIKNQDFLGSIFHLTYRGLKLDSKEGVEKILRWLDKTKVDLLIADPLYLFHNGKENDPKDMSRVCQVFQDINQNYGCSTLLIHHHGKPSQVEREGGDLHRGTSLLRDATDGNWTFTKVPQNKYKLTEPPSRYVLLSFEQRHTLSPEPILLKLDLETLWLEPEDIMQKQEVKVREVVECLKEHVKKHGDEMPNEDLLLALMSKLQTGDRACRQGIYKARDDGKILPGKGGGKGHKRTWKLP